MEKVIATTGCVNGHIESLVLNGHRLRYVAEEYTRPSGFEVIEDSPISVEKATELFYTYADMYEREFEKYLKDLLNPTTK